MLQKAKTPARMLAFPGLRLIITQPTQYAGTHSLSRKKAKETWGWSGGLAGKDQNSQPPQTIRSAPVETTGMPTPHKERALDRRLRQGDWGRRQDYPFPGWLPPKKQPNDKIGKTAEDLVCHDPGHAAKVEEQRYFQPN
jgi:hypothetical protein